jgi:CubicO group peptidase (beta-lactamase class C family)
MSGRLHTADHADLDVVSQPGAPTAPGKLPTTARLGGGGGGRPQIVFRVESAEAARAFAGMFGPRDGNGVAAGADAAVERAASSSGAPLPGALRERFESSLGADLSGVRLHTGEASAEAAGAVGAKAYTVGNDIHFGAGHYDPSSSDGLFLIAHEVAHTVQQQGGAPHRQNKLEVSTPGDAAEVEADRAAAAMVRGHAAALGTSAPRLHRKEEGPANTEPTFLAIDAAENAGEDAVSRFEQYNIAELTEFITRRPPLPRRPGVETTFGSHWGRLPPSRLESSQRPDCS